MDLVSIRNLVHNELIAADNLIDECLHSEISLIKQLGQHLIHSGGKRLRPLLVLLSAGAFGYQGNAHIELAAVIELVHTATLLHDDVVDTSDLRRGKRTANAIWGNAASILVGDFLYSRAFQLMVRTNSMRVMEILANATNVIAEGEILQLLNCKNPDVNEDICMDVIRAKTGTLFATASELGAVLCQQSEQTITAMREYGMHLGIAFQLADDALDYHASSEALGKNRGDDLAEGKITVPLVYALKHGSSAQTNVIRDTIHHAAETDREQVLAVIESTGAITYTYDLAQQYANRAIGFLSELPDSNYRAALIALAEFAVERSY
jgi:octaprenyl-diphosphate synthase